MLNINPEGPDGAYGLEVPVPWWSEIETKRLVIRQILLPDAVKVLNRLAAPEFAVIEIRAKLGPQQLHNSNVVNEIIGTRWRSFDWGMCWIYYDDNRFVDMPLFDYAGAADHEKSGGYLVLARTKL